VVIATKTEATGLKNNTVSPQKVEQNKPSGFNSDLVDDLLGFNKKPIRRQRNV